jgi:hypothetical protein
MTSSPAPDPTTRATWTTAFTEHLCKLNVRADHAVVATMANELWPGIGDLDPVDAAHATWEEWPEQES